MGFREGGFPPHAWIFARTCMGKCGMWFRGKSMKFEQVIKTGKVINQR